MAIYQNNFYEISGEDISWSNLPADYPACQVIDLADQIHFILDINWCQREKTEIWRKFQQAEEKNLPFEPEGPQGQRAQMAYFSLKLAGIFWILRFFPRTAVVILYISWIKAIFNISQTVLLLQNLLSCPRAKITN